ncbi:MULTISPECIES: N-acetylmuramic acid 6-phosphate etherase [unclassified Acidisoma]|jgi:N-acetylmuramic acid 6-phosphate etherase|uniref:N-acetylmuramic acid 6-phosphate etherase n=1 Tax=unclassified Acidisoma TaxID=2634065 RepID=UPI00131DD7ED|nr:MULTISPECIES: N-acetylmuramic acid 6-phosphate etherase [unclassified Acidisoma]
MSPTHSPAPLPTTERVTPRFRDLDLWDSAVALEALWEGQMAAVAALRPALPGLAAAADAAAARLAPGRGRLIYVGAGTSGRLAALDAAELPPTFDWPPERSLILIAGGTASLLRAAEGAEDDGAAAVAALTALDPRPEDVMVALAASGTTPWAVSAATAGRAHGMLVIGMANSPGTPLLAAAEHAVLLDTGAEAIAGSTRMKAGTAQKAALTLFSTLVMIRLGRIYRGRMVEMRPTNAKLAGRAARMIVELEGCSTKRAEAALKEAQGRIKLALVMVRKDVDAASAEALLLRHGGLLRAALEEAATSL